MYVAYTNNNAITYRTTSNTFPPESLALNLDGLAFGQPTKHLSEYIVYPNISQSIATKNHPK